MDALTLTIVSLIGNTVLGVIMYLNKEKNDTVRETLKEHTADIKHIKDSYFKKEDFREFKEELWVRLDRMENSFDRKLGHLSNERD
jgi:O-methyltransferase involved in polyketide biosynthesis